jgi:diguanylate cyclase (GGDEF)-like protein
MPAAAFHRRLLLGVALALYAVVFGAFLLFEKPGLGIGHFFYIPVALAALAAGTLGGIAGGAVGAALYALAIVLTPRLPAREVLTFATVIRSFTYCSCGALIGWFANQYRDHVATLRELAERDFLTGLLNMRIFDDALARRCASGRPFVLVLGDMDNLKELNNAHGHNEGNRALRQVADTIRAAVGAADQVARVGGDEFAVLTDGSLDEAQALVTVVQRRARREGLELSFGWAAFPADGVGPLELFRKADDRLLAAKLLGRNRRAVLAVAAAAEERVF